MTTIARTPAEQADHDRRNEEAAAYYRKLIEEMTPTLQPIAANPWTDPTELGLSAFGVELDPAPAIVPGGVPTARSSVRGIGCPVPTNGTLVGRRIENCYIGAKLMGSDTEIRGCRLAGNRDAGLWIAASTGSANCQSTQNHCYGARIACYNEGSQQYRACNDTYADSLVGYFGDGKVAGSHQTTLTNVLFQHNMVRDCVFGATCGNLVNCIVNVQRDVNEWNTIDIPGVISRSTTGSGNAKVGVELGTRCSIRGGVVELFDWKHPLHTASGRPCECVRVMPGSSSVVVDTLLVDSQGLNGAIGVHLMGAAENVRIEIQVDRGFDLPDSKAIVIEDASKCRNVNINVGIANPSKPPAAYVKVNGVLDKSNRITVNGVTLPQGRAA